MILHHASIILYLFNFIFAEAYAQHLADLKKVAEEKRQHHKKAYEKAIKNKISLFILPVHFNHIGVARSGKTTFRRRIMGEIDNLSEEGEFVQPSTGIAEFGGQVFIRNVCTGLGTIQSKVWSVISDLGEEANLLNQCIYQAVLSTNQSAVSEKPLPTKPVTSVAEATTVSVASSLPKQSLPKRSLWKKFLSLFDAGVGVKAPSKRELEETFSTINEVMEDAEWDKVKYLLDGLILLIHTDTGGQAEFLDLQASLVLGPSLNLLYRRLVDELDKQFETYFTNEEGMSTEREPSATTVEDVLFQALSSIACLGGCSFDGDEKLSQSKALFVGTHRDLITDDDLKKKDLLLQQRVMNTEFYGKNIIEFATDKQMMIAVNNMTGDQSEITEIRIILERIIERSFKKVAIPAAWLMLSLCLRKTGVRMMSLPECEELAAKLRISPQDLQHALWFLHHHIGVLLYYPEIESLKGTVICDIQVVFDSASNLIKNTFTFELVGHKRSHEFREKAQFSLKDVKEAALKHTNDLLPLEKLVDLLKDRNVLTVIPSSASSVEPTYFMPCVLRCATPEELLVSDHRDCDPPSLMLRYKCGYFPIGVFPAMITNLVSQQREDWQMISEGLRKNRVQFLVGDGFDKVTFISRPCFLEVAISIRDSSNTPVKSLCRHVRSVVQSTLDAVTSHLNYHFRMQYKFGFACPIHPETPREHICVVANESASTMRCLQDSNKMQFAPLDCRHKLWFSPASPPEGKEII